MLENTEIRKYRTIMLVNQNSELIFFYRNLPIDTWLFIKVIILS